MRRSSADSQTILSASVATAASTGEWLSTEWLSGEFTGNATVRSEASAARGLRRAWPFLLFAFADAAGGMLVAIRAPAMARTLGIGDAIIGLLVAAFAIAQVTSAVPWGRLSDQWGRRRVMIAGLLLIGASLLVLVTARSASVLLMARVLHGIGSGTLGVAVAALLDGTPANARAQVLGKLGAATSAGAIAGPAASLLDPSRWGLPAALPIPEAAMLVLLAVVGLQISRCAERPREQPASAQRRAGVAGVFGRPTITLLATYTLAAAAASGIPPMLPVLLTADRPGPNPAIALMSLGALGLVFRTMLVSPVVARWGNTRALRGGLMTMSIAVAILAVGQRGAEVWLAIVLLAMATALTFPSLGALLARVSEPSRRGAVMGMQQAVGGVARASMPLALGLSVGGADAAVLLCALGATLAAVSVALHRTAFRGARVPTSRRVRAADAALPPPRAPIARTTAP